MGTRCCARRIPPLLTGEARFVDDLVVPGALAPADRALDGRTRAHPFDRHDRGRVPIRASSPCSPAPDLQADFANPLPCAWPVTEDMKHPPHWPLASTRCATSETVWWRSWAETREAARDAADKVIIDYDDLSAVLDLEDARADRTLVHSDLGTNARYTWDLIPDLAAVDAAFATAVHTVKKRYVQQRLIAMAMEPRGVMVVPAPFGGDFTMYSVDPGAALPQDLHGDRHRHPGTEDPSRRAGGRRRLRLEARHLRRGSAVPRAREAAGAPGAMERGPQRERAGDGAGSRHDPGHRARGRRRRQHHRGPRPSARRHGRVPPARHARHPAAGRVPLSRRVRHSRVLVLLHRRVHEPDADRRVPGAGRPEATYAIERAVDALAAQIGVDPAELRRRNYIATTSSRSAAAAGLVFDSGDYEPALDRALEIVGYDALRAEQRTRRASAAGDERSISASGSRRTSRCAGSHRAGARVAAVRRAAVGRRRRCGCCPPARCRSSPDRRRTARATRRRGR